MSHAAGGATAIRISSVRRRYRIYVRVGHSFRGFHEPTGKPNHALESTRRSSRGLSVRSPHKRAAMSACDDLLRQRLPCALDERIVAVATPLEVEDAGSQEPVAPGWRDVEVVLQHGRAELVIVRIASFLENQHPSAIDEITWLGIGTGVGERLSSCV